jgi:ABC-type dipeptide/oligopeptide/nickel transport system permease subunit
VDRGSARLLRSSQVVARFLVVILLTYLGLLAVTFFIGRVIPIDPVLAIVGDRAPEHVIARVREELGLNKPLWEQFYIYVSKVLHGDFGRSVLTSNPVMQDIRRTFPATFELATLGIIIGAGIGVPLGVWAAVRRGGIVDQVVRIMGLIGYSIPIFWLGLMALVVFYARLGWVSGPGRIDVVYEYTLAPVTGLLLPRFGARRRVAGVRQRAVAPHPAGIAARLLLACVHKPHDALVHAERARAGVHRRGSGEGTFGDADHLAPRAAQRDGAARDRDRAFVRGIARRLGADRNRVRLAGAWPLPYEFAAERRHERGARRDNHRWFDFRRAQSPVGSPLPDARPAHPRDGAAVTGTSEAARRADENLHQWLMSDRPRSRRQAAFGRAYATWRTFARNRLAVVGLLIVIGLALTAAFADVLSPYSPYIGDLRTTRLLPPSTAHWFGTDDQGRDILSRVIFGSRITLFVVGLVAILAAPIGLAVGTLAGYSGGLIDAALMRITDIFLAFPRLILALAFVAALGPGIGNAVIAIALTSWPPYARIARAETLTLRQADYISAVRLIGASPWRSCGGTSCRSACRRSSCASPSTWPGSSSRRPDWAFLASARNHRARSGAR